MKRKFIEFLLVFIVACPAANAADAIIVRKRDIILGPGKSCAITFRLPENSAPVLFVQGRADTDRASRYAAYFTKRATLPPVSQLAENCWTMGLDGETLTPKDLDVLRPAEMIFAGPENEVAVPIFDAKSRTWLLKRDLEYMSTSRTDKQASAVGRFAWRPWFAHYYQHTFRLPRLKSGTHTITISVPENRSQVHFRDITVVSAPNGALPWHEDWMKLTFPWQPPQPDQLIEGPLEIRACAGEYEPVSFGLHALKNLPELDVRITNLSAPKNATSITSKNAKIFAITPLKRESLGEAGFLARMPFVPEKWQRHSPELLIPLSEKKPALNAGLSQRFYVDIRVPGDQTPGVYRGKISVLSAGKPLLTIPLKLRVLPFKLAPARSDYWMWRLTWSPIWKPENVACLKDIKQHGYAGLVRTCGASFKFSITEDGELQVDTSDYKKAVEALKKAGLRLQVADTGIAGSLLKTIANHLNIDTKDPVKDLPTLKEFLRKKIENKRAIKKADQDLKGSDFGPGKDDAVGENLADELVAEPQDKEPAEKIAARRAARLQKKIRSLAVQGFRKVKRITENMGLKLFVFPVDEPDGTPWRRRWTAYAAGLAKEAGLETWSTRNAVDWEGHIDHKAFGLKIHDMYQEPSVMSASYEGKLAFAPLPMIGAFRGGKNYHFDGEIDEVRIYNRALSDRELGEQYKAPAKGKLLAYYNFESPTQEGIIADSSGNENHLKIVGTPEHVKGHTGHAMRFNGIDEHLAPVEGQRTQKSIDLSEGYTISLWYRGKGAMFGMGYDFYPEAGSRLRFSTTKQKRRWFGHTGFQSRRFWQHITYTFDPGTHTVKAYVQNPEMRRWYRNNIHWNYVQIRSMPPKNPRYKTGIMAWYYSNMGELNNITTFCYDWNTNHLYVVYPKNGDRFGDNVEWYRTVGWEGTREGIDDARYLQTLCKVLQEKRSLTHREAVREIQKMLGPVGIDYDIGEVIQHFGGYNAFRRRVIDRILEETSAK